MSEEKQNIKTRVVRRKVVNQTEDQQAPNVDDVKNSIEHELSTIKTKTVKQLTALGYYCLTFYHFPQELVYICTTPFGWRVAISETDYDNSSVIDNVSAFNCTKQVKSDGDSFFSECFGRIVFGNMVEHVTQSGKRVYATNSSNAIKELGEYISIPLSLIVDDNSNSRLHLQIDALLVARSNENYVHLTASIEKINNIMKVAVEISSKLKEMHELTFKEVENAQKIRDKVYKNLLAKNVNEKESEALAIHYNKLEESLRSVNTYSEKLLNGLIEQMTKDV